jgi:hypothetical protein
VITASRYIVGLFQLVQVGNDHGTHHDREDSEVVPTSGTFTLQSPAKITKMPGRTSVAERRGGLAGRSVIAPWNKLRNLVLNMGNYR